MKKKIIVAVVVVVVILAAIAIISVLAQTPALICPERKQDNLPGNMVII